MARRAKPKQRSMAPVLLIGAGVLVLIGLLIYMAVSGGAGGTTTPAGGEIPFPEVERVSLSDANQAFNQKSAVFLDVRDADSYNARHIPGAVNIPVGELESRTGELDPNQWIITYCT